MASQVGTRFGLQPSGPPAGHVNVGASQSFTLISNWHCATGSVTPSWNALHITVVVPTGYESPGLWSQLTVTSASQLGAIQFTTASHFPASLHCSGTTG